jgi:hypothetical protein
LQYDNIFPSRDNMDFSGEIGMGGDTGEGMH